MFDEDKNGLYRNKYRNERQAILHSYACGGIEGDSEPVGNAFGKKMSGGSKLVIAPRLTINLTQRTHHDVPISTSLGVVLLSSVMMGMTKMVVVRLR